MAVMAIRNTTNFNLGFYVRNFIIGILLSLPLVFFAYHITGNGQIVLGSIAFINIILYPLSKYFYLSLFGFFAGDNIYISSEEAGIFASFVFFMFAWILFPFGLLVIAYQLLKGNNL